MYNDTSRRTGWTGLKAFNDGTVRVMRNGKILYWRRLTGIVGRKSVAKTFL